MTLLVRLLSMNTARAAYEWMMFIWAFTTVFVGDINLDRFQRWLWRTPPPEQQRMLQDDPALRADVEKLMIAYQHYVDMQHDNIALRREMLTLPPLPDEGY